MSEQMRRYDPEGYVEIERAKLATAIEQFRAKEISEDVFKACLYSRGFRGAELRAEFNYHDDER